MRFCSQILLACLFSVTPFFVQGEEPKSPFEPDGFRSQEKVTNTTSPPVNKVVSLNPISNEIEMRGYFKLGDVYYFSIHQKKMDLSSKRKKSEWIQIGEEAFDEFTAKDFNPETMKLLVARSGQTQTEEISLYESQWEKQPLTGNKNKSRIPSPLQASSNAFRSGGSNKPLKMTPKPNYVPELPPAIARTSIARAFANRSIVESSRPEGSANGSGSSSSSSSGFMPRAYLPPRFTNSPVPQTVPSSAAAPPIGSPETGGALFIGPSSGLEIPTDPVTGEIDLDSLPPPPPPPTIKPPGPPPNIEPNLEDRGGQ